MLCLTFTADGRFVVTGSDDGVYRVWDANNGKLQRAWKAGEKAVRQVVPLRDAIFVAAGDDGEAMAWDAAQPQAGRIFSRGK
jgi:WD40 repeat protein